MNRTKAVLIIGGSGFIGTHLATRLRDGYKVFATYDRHQVAIPGVTFLPFDVENRAWVKRVVSITQPDVVIYAAGQNDVGWADANPRDAEHVHTGGAATVSNVADIMQPKFIYLSNCYAFDGGRGNYHETDVALPTSVLGKVKLSGENFIRGKSLNYVIIRSSPLYGRGNGRNLSFMDRLRMSLDRGEKIELNANELHSFAPVDGLTTLVAKLVDTGLRNKFVHYGGLTKVTQLEFAKLFAKRFGYDPNLVTAARPKHGSGELLDYSLNSTQMAEVLKIQPLLLEQGFDLLEKDLVPRL